jgi:hypothetical protein
VISESAKLQKTFVFQFGRAARRRRVVRRDSVASKVFPAFLEWSKDVTPVDRIRRRKTPFSPIYAVLQICMQILLNSASP